MDGEGVVWNPEPELFGERSGDVGAGEEAERDCFDVERTREEAFGAWERRVNDMFQS